MVVPRDTVICSSPPRGQRQDTSRCRQSARLNPTGISAPRARCTRCTRTTFYLRRVYLEWVAFYPL